MQASLSLIETTMDHDGCTLPCSSLQHPVGNLRSDRWCHRRAASQAAAMQQLSHKPCTNSCISSCGVLTGATLSGCHGVLRCMWPRLSLVGWIPVPSTPCCILYGLGWASSTQIIRCGNGTGPATCLEPAKQNCMRNCPVGGSLTAILEWACKLHDWAIGADRQQPTLHSSPRSCQGQRTC